jgi:hypothetical protein
MFLKAIHIKHNNKQIELSKNEWKLLFIIRNFLIYIRDISYCIIYIKYPLDKRLYTTTFTK